MAEKGLFYEIGMLFKAIGTGVGFVFFNGPKSLFTGGGKNKAQAQVDAAKGMATVGEKGTYNLHSDVTDNRDFIRKLGDWMNDQYNKIPSVRKKREAYEASLVPLVLDPQVDGVKSDVKTTYKYVARNAKGKIVTDYFPEYSRMDVYSYLTDEKMTVYEISTSKSTSFLHSQSSAFQTKMATKDLIFWLAQLSTYIKSGIPLTDGVRVLAQQDKRKKYKGLYDSLIFELTTGQTFSEALSRQGTAFPALLVNMIKSAEMTGSIEKTLDEMSEYYQEIEDTKRAVIGAMAYPSVVMIFALGIVIFMLVYIVPKFTSVYESMNAEVNAITQVCLDLSEFFQTKYMYLIGGIALVIITYVVLWRNSLAFKGFMQRFFMHLPIVGKLMIAKEMNLFARTFASLQKNNVLLTDSIDILSKITSNEVYKDIMMRTINNLIKGNKMSETFADHWAVPEIAYFMIVTGESTGELAEMLDKVADYYQKEERNTVGQIKTFIEPVMIVSLAVVVGFILIAILVPMFDMYSLVQ